MALGAARGVSARRQSPMLSVIVVPYACRGAELAKFIGEFWGRILTLYNRPTRVNVPRSVRWIDLTVVGDIAK